MTNIYNRVIVRTIKQDKRRINMSQTNFAIVGGGWRSKFYLRIARALPAQFKVCGMVVRDESKGQIIENKWGVSTYRNIDQLLKEKSPDFVVVAVSWSAAPKISIELAKRKIAILSETPPAPDLEGLIELYNLLQEYEARYQVAEQYHLQPLHAVRIGIVDSGLLGDQINQVQISVCHDYHAISLIRKFLGIKFENVKISAQKFETPLIAGPDFEGNPEIKQEKISEQTIATLDFGDKMALYDFSDDQYFSWIRDLRLLIRGERGEINNKRVKYLKDYKTPIEFNLKRLNAGEDGNLEGYYLKGILAGNDWAYKNPFIPGRITDDEIAIASCLKKMSSFVEGGKRFYSFAEAAQDHYLSLLIKESIDKNRTVESRQQPWAEQ